MSDILYFVIPCYNEEEVLPETSRRLAVKMRQLMEAGKISEKSRVCFVNDGSKDKTWQIIQDLHAQNPLFSGICLSRNRGHQNALLAGLLTVREFADMVISMDADLQDDIEACDQMIDKYYEGCDIVYGVRSARKTDTFFKRTTAEGFYSLMRHMGANTVSNHADYRLMSKRALEGLSQFKEVNLFLRGIVPMIGYPSDVVYYERAERFAGESKYPLKKMLAFALLHGTACDGGNRGRLDLPCGLGLGDRRSHPPVPRHHRRVHRQDLSGDKGPAQVPHRTVPGCGPWL